MRRSIARCKTPFVTEDDLIFVQGRVDGPRGSKSVRLVLDTGSACTTITTDVANAIGYTRHDSKLATTVRTATGEEQGYVLKLQKLSVLGVNAFNLPVNVFELAHDDVDGLIGMNSC